MGFAPFLLVHLKMLLEQNYTGIKITPSGFLKMLIENNPSINITSVNGDSINGLKTSTASGQVREVKYKYLPRITPQQIADEDNCDNDFGFQYSEGTLRTPLFSKAGFQVEWDFIERYEAEAARAVQMGNPSTPALQEMVDQLMHVVNGMVTNINGKLLSSLSFGVNASTGLSTAKNININKDGNVYDLSDGVTEILSDAAFNEFGGSPLIVGAGLMNKFELSKAATGLNGGGLNRGAQAGYTWYYDIISEAVLGANTIGVFSPKTVGFVDVDKYIGWKTGKFGNSWFAQIMLPVESGVEGTPVMMPFNLQIQEVDCPTEGFDGYETRTMGRGYKIMISKNFGLFQQPTDAYQAGDRLAGTNGSLLYKVTNDCDSCDSIVPPLV